MYKINIKDKNFFNFFERKRLNRKLNIYIKNAIIDTASHILENVKERIPQAKKYKPYKTSLDLADLDKNEVVIFSNDKKVDINDLNPTYYVVYFEPRKKRKLSNYAKFLVSNSPFVLGMVRWYPDSLRPFVRRVSKGEVDVARERNLKIENDLKRLEEEGRELKIVDVDVMFSALRLEFGFKGYRHKPIWRPLIQKLDLEKIVDDSEIIDVKEKKIQKYKGEKLDDYFAERIL